MLFKKILSLLFLAIFSTKAMEKTQNDFIMSCVLTKDSTILQAAFGKVPQEKRSETANEALIWICASPEIEENKALNVINFLFTHGASTKYKNIYDQTPLVVAICIGQHTSILDRLKQ